MKRSSGGIQPESAQSPGDDRSATSALRRSRWYGRVPITSSLAAAIGFLVLLTAGIVFAVGVWIAQRNTFDLLSDNAHQAISADLNQIEQYLRPAEHQAKFIAEKIERNEIDPTDLAQFETFMLGSLAAVPQIEAVVFVNNELESLVVSRGNRLNQNGLSIVDNSNDPVIRENMKAIRQGPYWQSPIWRERVQKTYLSRAHPVVVDGEFVGAVLAVVAVRRLSEFVSMKDLDTAGNRFILYGRDYILAHWLIVDGYPDKSAEHPLPRLDRFGDPVLSSIWQEEGLDTLGLNLPEGTEGHLLEVLGGRYIYFYKKLEGFGDEPLIVGTYFQASERPEEIERMLAALVAGLVALVLSLLAAIVLGRRIARPIVEFSSAAVRIRDLDVAKIEELPGSMFRELNDQSVAFNAMLRALRWFEYYVPKKVVEQIIRHGDIQDSESTAQEVTVMFTDMVGFSTISEDMKAEEVAAFINHHFSIVVNCIENENGTVDKFMGDAVMAFWQESETQEHSAERACRAALAISTALSQDNVLRVSRGDAPVGIRIGIHTGIATVGNIGAPGRLNYTIIGDTVNIGQRLELLGKKVNPSGAGVSILISSDTAQKLTSAFTPVPLGSRQLQGRVTGIDVYEL
ncbi:MAG: adenylate/guanylate cyclase domain-containing protein [Granulosicoccus sp.]